MMLMKYDILKFTMRFSKSHAKKERKQRHDLEKKPLHAEENQCIYSKCKRILEEIYANIVEGIRIRSRC